MSDYISRMREEHDQLTDRLNKLNDFIGTQLYHTLEKHDQLLLTRQAAYMHAYSRTLAERISRA